jgi:hypothetical protein
MNPIFLALAALAPAEPVPAQAAEGVQAPAPAPTATLLAPAEPAPAQEPEEVETPEQAPTATGEEKTESETIRSAAATRVADWIAATGDNASLPYAIIDKPSATLFLYDAEGKAIGEAPVLIGVAPGDEASPGIGSKNLAEIGPAERTTPAGRFLAKYGKAAGRQQVLWVDYATSVALHPIPPGSSRKEKRRERMLSETSEDNRITFGCINVPKVFYRDSLRALFQKDGGYVYVLPDTKPLEEVFPQLRLALRKSESSGSDLAR